MSDTRLDALADALEAANTGHVRSYRTEAAAILGAIDAAVAKSQEPAPTPAPEPLPSPELDDDDEPEPKARRKPARRY